MRYWFRGSRVAAHGLVPSKGADGELCSSPPPSLLLHHFSGISSFSSSATESFGSGSSSGSTGGAAGVGAAAAAPLPDGAGDAGCVGGAAAAACFGGGMRTRSAGPILPRMSTTVGNTAMTLLAQPAVSSPKAPRRVRLFVLLSTRPRASLVNQTTSLVSLSLP